MPAPKDLTGRKFARLFVLRLGKSRNGRRFWVCQCDCGNLTEVTTSNLGKCIFSCGCLKLEIAKNNKTSVTHGMKYSPEYRVWNAMKSRCTNPSVPAYKNYGARGITYDPAWEKFEQFYADMGARPDGLELDRIDNNKGYYAANCRWTTRSENIKNTRRRARDEFGRFTAS